MLLLIARVMFGLWLYNGGPWLEAESSNTSVRAYVDGKRADAYVIHDGNPDKPE